MPASRSCIFWVPTKDCPGYTALMDADDLYILLPKKPVKSCLRLRFNWLTSIEIDKSSAHPKPLAHHYDCQLLSSHRCPHPGRLWSDIVHARAFESIMHCKMWSSIETGRVPTGFDISSIQLQVLLFAATLPLCISCHNQCVAEYYYHLHYWRLIFLKAVRKRVIKGLVKAQMQALLIVDKSTKGW